MSKNSFALQTMDELHDMQLNFHKDNQLILLAGEKDRAQNNFINAVFNTRKAGEDVSEAITRMTEEGFQLKRGEYAARRILLILEEKVRHVLQLLDVVNFSADTVSEPVEYPVDKLEECHEVVTKIKMVVVDLTTALHIFEASLKEDPTNEAPENFNDVLAKRDELYTLVNSFPALHKNNFRIEAIQRSLMNVNINRMTIDYWIRIRM